MNLHATLAEVTAKDPFPRLSSPRRQQRCRSRPQQAQRHSSLSSPPSISQQAGGLWPHDGPTLPLYCRHSFLLPAVRRRPCRAPPSPQSKARKQNKAIPASGPWMPVLRFAGIQGPAPCGKSDGQFMAIWRHQLPVPRARPLQRRSAAARNRQPPHRASQQRWSCAASSS